MAVYKDPVITQAGIEFLRDISLSPNKLTAIQAVTSEDIIADPENATAITGIVQSVNYSLYDLSNNQFVFESQFDNAGVTVQYSVNTIGYYVGDGQGNNILLAVIAAEVPGVIGPGTAHQNTFSHKMIATLSNVGSLTIETSYVGFATKEFVMEMIKQHGGGGGGGSFGIPHAHNFRAMSITSGVQLSWDDPEDLVLNGVMLSAWKQTTLVRKQGGWPESVTDGDVVVVNDERGQYNSNNPFIDTGIAIGETYFYQLFPESTTGIFNLDSANRFRVDATGAFSVPAVSRTFNGSDYVWIPAFRFSDISPTLSNNFLPAFYDGSGNLLDGFWYAKWHCSLVGAAGTAARSISGVLPAVSISFDNSIAACNLMQGGQRMSTAAEKAAVAWQCFIRGFQPGGNNNSSAAVVSGSNNVEWYHNNDFSGIEGLNGNVWEWLAGLRYNVGEINIIPGANAQNVDHSANSPLWKAIMPDGSLVAPGTAGTIKLTGTSRPFAEMSVDPSTISPVALELLMGYGILPLPGTTTDDYDEDNFWITLTGERIPYGGGTWGDGVRAGVFARRTNARTPASTNFGFRSAFLGTAP
jgi:hypothetical protein